ncbi:MAG: hypothetical protein JNM18_08275 [Planctomycetaceae bacterium]|nr:hypothetical protein [Planctomycetaceae bacterium]
MTEPRPPIEQKRGLAAALALLRDLGSGVIRHFVWGELREGGLDLRGLDRNVRALSWFGLSVLVATIAALIFADSLRSAFDLILIAADPVRGQLAPTLLFPLTLFLLIVAWTFALAGALHAHFAIRWLTHALFGLNALAWINPILLAGHEQFPTEYFAVIGALAGVALIFTFLGPAKSRPALEFALLFALVSVIFLVAQQYGLAGWQRYGVPVQIAKMQFNIVYLGGLITPLMILIGVDIAEFARRAADWTTDTVRDHLPRYIVTVALIGLFGWRWYVVVHELRGDIAQTSLGEQLGGYCGALVELLAIIGVFRSVTRARSAREPWSEPEMVETCLRFAFPLVILYQAVSLLAFLLLNITLACSEAGAYERFGSHLSWAQQFLSQSASLPWHYIVSAGVGGAALVAWHRGKQHAALYLGLFSVLAVWDLLTASDGLLARLYWRGETPGELWWLVVLSVAVIYRWRRGELTPLQRADACFMLLILALFRQRDFIENPFTPLLGFAGSSFIAFGLVWDLATHGAWANHDSRVLPRVSRLFLYLGYIILAGAVLNWAVATHDLDGIQKLTGGAALLGFDRFGKPLLYAIFLLRICGRIPARNTSAATAADST